MFSCLQFTVEAPEHIYLHAVCMISALITRAETVYRGLQLCAILDSHVLGV